MGDPLLYHALPHPGKFKTIPSKPLKLSLAYSPGVAEACRAIVENPQAADQLTIRRSLVAVISNGTAVLGLGDIGPLASKPVMEGKAVLFQEFSKLNALSLEIQENDPQRLIEIIAALEPSFGGINLEDIKAPECFYVEEALKSRLNIPVFHDDQHGTAITVSAALLNALKIVGKNLSQIRCVVSGAGASALACLRLLRLLGLPLEAVTVCDTNGVIHAGRDDLTSYKKEYAHETSWRHMSEALKGADVFLGLSRKGLVSADMISEMAPRAVVFPLANPDPEIETEEILSVRDDVLIGSGRSETPNQVNNLLCFPYMFRGALDVGARQINDAMMIACVKELQEIAQEGFQDITGHYGGRTYHFGKDYFIPKPFDPRLLERLPLVIAKAALDSGIAEKGFSLTTYRKTLRTMAYPPALAALKADSCGRKPSSFYILTGRREKDALMVSAAKGVRSVMSPTLVGRREWINAVDSGNLPFLEKDAFKPLPCDVCLFGREEAPYTLPHHILYGRLVEKSAIFVCSSRTSIERGELTERALSAIRALGYQPQLIEENYPTSFEEGVGYLPIHHSFPLIFGQDFPWKGDMLGLVGPFSLDSRWHFVDDDLSLPDLIQLSCFAEAMR